MPTTQIAKLNYLRIAPRKVRSVANLVSGLSVNEAEAQLMVQRRRPAKALLKLLRSAVANAKTNQKLDPNHLFIASFRVDGGPMLKRMLPRARGSASPIEKKMSNVTLVLGVNTNLTKKYEIVVPKKAKVPPGEERKHPKAKGAKEPQEPRQETERKPEKKREKKGGFLKRVFNPGSRKNV